MRRFIRVTMIAGIPGVLIALGLLYVRPALAAPPLPTPTPQSESGCRGCHGETDATLTFTSGETIRVEIDLSALDRSPHSANAASGIEAVSCLGCHNDEINHQYPHKALTAISQREFAVGVSKSCESCHYAHKPFHGLALDKEDPETEVKVDPNSLPTCVDCHGSHAIARVEELRTAMPPLCLACHVDESDAWAQAYLAPRPGVGAGATGYAGSARCNGCHDDKYFTWQQTLHARFVQDPQLQPDAVVGDFNVIDPDRNFDLADVALVVGSRWRQVYVSKDVTGTFTILNAQWNVAKREWEPYVFSEGPTTDWIQDCGSCHVTGLANEDGSFTEYAIGCESCHGPGQAHAEDPTNVKPYAAVDDQVCGACHSRGVSPEGHPYPGSYQPGDDLSAHFTMTDDPEALWADGSARLNHQQYMDWNLGSPMSTSPTTACITCHRVHDNGVQPGMLQKPINELCVSCHSDRAALIRHIPYHEKASLKREFVCTDCHMPKMATSVNEYDIHNHSFLQPDPEGSIEHGGFEVMPNACNLCHTEYGEGPAWAAQMIDWTMAQATPDASKFFGPGPTPTSPPPPTPLPSVGLPVETYAVPTGEGLRIAFFAGIGLLAALVIGLGVRALRARRNPDA